MTYPPIDIAIYDTSSYSLLEEKWSQSTTPARYLKPIELNPLNDKLFFLNQFSKIEDNWDGCGAKAPNESTILNAIDFLKLLSSKYQKILNTDEINITPYGTVVMDWYKDDNTFISIEIGNSKIGFFSETPDGENPFEQSISFSSNEIPHQVIKAFNKVFSK